MGVLETLLNFLIFIFLSFWVFYAVGFFALRIVKEKLEDQEIIILSFVLGIILFLILTIVFGSLNLRMAPLLFLVIISFTSLFKFKKKLFNPWKLFLKDRRLLVIIILGILVQGFINFPSGFLYKDGLLFWSSQGHDGIWHVSVMEEIKNNFPPQNPLFSGHSLYNYHYLVDLVMGGFLTVFPFFSSLDLYFRFFPVIFSFMIGMSIYSFVNKWQQDRQIGYLAVIFTYFVGSFGYIANYLRGGSIFGGETVFWAAQGNTILGNPPHAISYSLITTFLLSILFFLQKRSKAWFLIAFLIAALLAGFKVSGGLVLLVGLGFASLVDLIFNRRFSLVLLSFLLGVSNLLTFKFMTAPGASSFLMFLPWWFIRTTIVDRLGWIDLEHKRQHYLSKGTWNAYLRVVQLETEAFLLFAFGNIGVRFFGLYIIFGKLKNFVGFIKNPIEVLLLFMMLTGFLIPIFFVQKGIIYNNIQFMQYCLLILGFYAAIAVYKLQALFDWKYARVFVLILIMVFALPTVIGNLTDLYGDGRKPLAKISNQEIEALNYLKNNSSKDQIILNMPFNQYLKDKFKSEPRPIFSWYSTAYISALTGRHTYLSSQEQVMIMGYPLDERVESMNSFFKQLDFKWNKRFLDENNISYIYIPKQEMENEFDPQQNSLEVFFENNEVIIYRVKAS